LRKIEKIRRFSGFSRSISYGFHSDYSAMTVRDSLSGSSERHLAACYFWLGYVSDLSPGRGEIIEPEIPRVTDRLQRRFAMKSIPLVSIEIT